jgi:hypothetical protein
MGEGLGQPVLLIGTGAALTSAADLRTYGALAATGRSRSSCGQRRSSAATLVNAPQ